MGVGEIVFAVIMGLLFLGLGITGFVGAWVFAGDYARTRDPLALIFSLATFVLGVMVVAFILASVGM